MIRYRKKQKSDHKTIDKTSHRQIESIPIITKEINNFNSYAAVSGREDSINYLPQTVVDVQDLVSYSGNNKIIVKDLIYDVPDNEAIEVSYNKSYEQLDTFYSSSIPEDGNEIISQKALINRENEIEDISSGLFSGLYDDNRFLNYGYAEQAVSNWTTRISPEVLQWRGVCWAPECPNGLGGFGLFVAVGETGRNRVMTSPDGINWTSRTCGIVLEKCNSSGTNVTCKDTSGLVVGMQITLLQGSGTVPTNTFITSIIDSTQFTTNNTITGLNNSTLIANNAWFSVCWSPKHKLFVAVSTGSISGTNNRVMTSPDGINWTFRTTPSLSDIVYNWLGVCWSPERNLFVAVANNNIANIVMTSSDGIEWSLQNTNSGNGLRSIVWAPECPNGLGGFGLFVACGTNRIITSPNGIEWEDETIPINNGGGTTQLVVTWSSICWSCELKLFVCVSVTANPTDPKTSPPKKLMTSPDGINWTLRDAPSDEIVLSGVCWSPELGIFVACGQHRVSSNPPFKEIDTTHRIITSPDGISWTFRRIDGDNIWRGICWSHELGIFVSVSSSSSGGFLNQRVMTSQFLNKPNIVGTAYSGKQWMSAREVIKPEYYDYDLTHSGFFRYYDNGWEEVPIKNQELTYIEAQYFFNTDIKYLKHNWYGLRGYTKIQEITSNTPTMTINSSTRVCDITFNTSFDYNIKTAVSDAIEKIQILYSSHKNADTLEYHKLRHIIDSIPTIPNDIYQTMLTNLTGDYLFTLYSARAVPLDITHIKVGGCSADKLAITGMVSLDFTVRSGLGTIINPFLFNSNCVYERAFVILLDFNLSSGKLYWPVFAESQYTTLFDKNIQLSTQGGIQGLINGIVDDDEYGYTNIVPSRARVIVSSGVNNLLLLEGIFVNKSLPDTYISDYPYRHLVFASPIAFENEYNNLSNSNNTSINNKSILFNTMIVSDTYQNNDIFDKFYNFEPIRGPLATHITYNYGTFCSFEYDLLQNINGTSNFSAYGWRVSLSSDGNILAVGAPQYNTGTLTNAGQVIVYQRSGDTWVPRGNPITGTVNERFMGASVSLSSDGNILAIGATQMNLNPPNVSNLNDVYIYDWNGSDWILRSTLSNTNATGFGFSISLSSDGNTLAVGAPLQVTINNGGRVFVYEWSGSNWNQKGTTILNSGSAYLGLNVSLSSNANILAVGAPLQATNGGRAIVYEWSGSNWTLITTINGTTGSTLGEGIILSSDGNLLAVGAPLADPLGITNAGQVTIYQRSGNSWILIQTINGSNIEDRIGLSLALSSDKTLLAIGSFNNKGKVLIYQFNQSEYVYRNELDGNTNDFFGYDVDLSSNGNVLAVGAIQYISTPPSLPGYVNIYEIYGCELNLLSNVYTRNNVINLGHQSLQPLLDTYHKLTGVYSGNDYTWVLRTLPGFINNNYERPRFFSTIAMDLNRADYRELQSYASTYGFVEDIFYIEGLSKKQDKWNGGVLGHDGKIYGVPSNSDQVLIIDSTTNTVSYIDNIKNGDNKWRGGVLAPNGKIYCVPSRDTQILVIDTDDNDSISYIPNTEPYLPTGEKKWSNGVLVGKKIYCIPEDATQILVIDTDDNDSISYIPDTEPYFDNGGTKWGSCVLAPNGKIYCIPLHSNKILVIDTNNNDAISYIDVGVFGENKWMGGVLALNGKIYCIPSHSDKILIINPQDDSISYITGLSNKNDKWDGGVLAPDGKIYGIPFDSDEILVIDPTTNQVSYIDLGFNPTNLKWSGGVLAPNGCIYAIPYHEDRVLVICQQLSPTPLFYGLNHSIAISTFEYDKSVVYNTGTAIRTSGVNPSLSSPQQWTEITNNDIYNINLSPYTITNGVMTGGRLLTTNEKQGISKATTIYIERQQLLEEEEENNSTIQIPYTIVSSDVRNVYEKTINQFDTITIEEIQNNNEEEEEEEEIITNYYSVLSTSRANIEGCEIRQCQQNLVVIPADNAIITHFDDTSPYTATTYKTIENSDIPIYINNACAFCIEQSNNWYETRYIIGRTRDITNDNDTSPILFSDIVYSSYNVSNWDGKTWYGNTEWYIDDTITTKVPDSIFDILAYSYKTIINNITTENCLYIAVGTPVQYDTTSECDKTYSIWISDGTLTNNIMKWYAVKVETCNTTLRRIKNINDMICVSGDYESFAIFKLSDISISSIINGSNWCSLDFSNITEDTENKSIYDFAAVSCTQLAARLSYTDGPGGCIQSIPGSPSKYPGLPVFTLLYGEVDETTNTIKRDVDTIIISGYFDYDIVDGWIFVSLDYVEIDPPNISNPYSAGRHLYCASTVNEQVFVGGQRKDGMNAIQVIEAKRENNSLISYRPNNCETIIIPSPPSSITLCTSNQGIYDTEYVRCIDSYNNYVFILAVDINNKLSTILYNNNIFNSWAPVDNYNVIANDLCIQLNNCCSPDDRIPTICKLTNTRITLPAFLCPDNNIDWKIKYSLIDYEEPQPEPEPCPPCQFVGGPCDLTRSVNTLFKFKARNINSKRREIKKDDIKGFSLDKYKLKSSSTSSIPLTRSNTIKCGCSNKGNISL